MRVLVLMGVLLLSMRGYSQDPNFYIYLCFGQSNMQGAGAIEEEDRIVDERFKVMEAVNCSNLNRTKGNWYTAKPPLCRCYTGLSPADYFGRTMVEYLPDSVTIGVINVSVAGCKIELFDKDNYGDYVSSVKEDWLTNIINEYDGNPYGYLVDLAKQAQGDGVIKGFLLHQGESNTGDKNWPSKVKQVYNNLITDLELDADSIPLLAGEVVHADQGGICASMNTIIASLPDTLPNSYVISSSKCTDGTDNLHFDAAGYRRLGTRYAIQMLALMGIEAEEPEIPVNPEGTDLVFLEPECADNLGENWEIVVDSSVSNYIYITSKSDIQSLDNAAGVEGLLTLPFSVDTTGDFTVYARVTCPSYEDDSFWVGMDDGPYSMANGLMTGLDGWQWRVLNTYSLTKGEHTINITYRENGALLDKICVSNYTDAPTQIGDLAINACEFEIADTTGTDTGGDGNGDGDNGDGTTSTINSNVSKGYSLGQNYPNPFHESTTISFHVPTNTFVSLKVYNVLGEEIAELAGKVYSSGEHLVEISNKTLAAGNYFYTIKTEAYSATRKMVVTASE